MKSKLSHKYFSLSKVMITFHNVQKRFFVNQKSNSCGNENRRKNIVFQHHYTQCIVLYSSLRVKQNESTLSHDCKDHNFLWSKKSMHIDKK